MLRSSVACLVVVGCLVVFVPLAPSFPTDSLDSGWQFALNAAVEKGMVFGRDIIFTFGPYASAETGQYHPATDARMVWSAALLAVAFAAGLLSLAQDRYKLSVLLTLPLLGLLIVGRDPLFFCNPMVFILLVARITTPETHYANLPATLPVKFTLAILLAALSLTPLIKGTFGAAAFIAIGLGWLLLMVRGRKMLAVSGALLFLAAISAFWLAAGQPLAQLLNFFVAQQLIVSGYSDAMSSFGPFRECAIYLAACGFLAFMHFRFFRSSGPAGIVLAIGVALILFVAFKAAFIRHDGHALIAASVMGFVGWILAIGLPGSRSILGLATCLVAWGAIVRPYTGLTVSTVKDRLADSFLNSATGLAVRAGGAGALRDKYEESLKSIRAHASLPQLEGATDTYSFGQSVLLAHGLDWTPRPVFQSYSAYTPALLELNSAHLVGDAAPRNILFAVQPIDNRLPSLEDGLSWPTLLARYEPIAFNGGMAVLQRTGKATPNPVVREPAIVTGRYGLGEEIPLPVPSEVLWAKIAMKPTMLGELVAVIYKLPQLQIEFRMADEDKRQFRYIAEMGETGFVVSPVVQATYDFLALKLQDKMAYFVGSWPRSMSISVKGDTASNWLWNDRVSVQLFEMDIPTQHGLDSLIFGSGLQALSPDTVKPPETNVCAINAVNNHTGDRLSAPVSGVLRVEGWAAMSIKDGAAPNRIRLTLNGRRGDMYYVDAKIIPRNDVNQFYGKPEMGNIGYIATANVSALDGEYTLGVRMSANGLTLACSRRIALPIVALHLGR